MTLGLIIAGVLGTSGVMGWNFASSLKEGTELGSSYGTFLNNIRNSEVSHLNLEDVALQMYQRGVINQTDYQSVMNTAAKLSQDGFDINASTDTLARLANKLGSKDSVLLTDFLQKASQTVPNIGRTIWDASKAFGKDSGNVASQITGAPSPDYFDTEWEGREYNAEPIRPWTSAELAELHNVDYDIDNIYDLVRSGTSAQVGARMAEADRIRNESLTGEAVNEAAYLNQLRDVKSEAIQKGATDGAQRANELLASLGMISNQTQRTSEANQARFDTVNDALLQDAQARLNARDQMEALGRMFLGNSQYYYATDAERFERDWLQNARMYGADQSYRGTQQEANAAMYANNVAANAQIAGYRNAANQVDNEIYSMWNIAFNEAQGRGESQDQAANTAASYVDNWLFSNHKNSQGFFDWQNRILNTR